MTLEYELDLLVHLLQPAHPRLLRRAPGPVQELNDGEDDRDAAASQGDQERVQQEIDDVLGDKVGV